jgi:MoaA/NifB/PqqE/SkfB family radical SAM enzyme
MTVVLGSKGGVREYEEPLKSRVKALLERSLRGEEYPEDPSLFEVAAIGYIRRFAEGKLSWKELHEFFVRRARLRQVSLDVTNKCNLKCTHCFYTADSDKITSLTFPEWQRILDQVYRLGVNTVTIAGKEPFISPLTMEVLRYLDGLKARNQHPFHYGVVTNGTLLHRYVGDLATLNMDYLDVSIDGLRATHDRFRGQGTFDRAFKNLKAALERRAAEKIFVASILHQENAKELLELVEFFCREGVSHFNIGLFFPTPYTPPSLVLTDETLLGFLEALGDWARGFEAGRRVEIVIDYNSTVLCYLPPLFEAGILSLENIFVDMFGNFYTKKVYKGGVEIFIEFPPFMEFSYWGVARIKDGYYIGGCEPLTRQGEGWRDYAVGSVLEEPLEVLYRRSLEVQLAEILRRADAAALKQAADLFRYTLGGDHLYTLIVKGGGVDYVWEQKQMAHR